MKSVAEVTHTIEWKKEYLKSYLNNKRKLESLNMQTAELREKIQSVKAMSYSDIPKSSSPQTDLSDYIVRLEEMDEDITELTKVINKKFEIIEKAILKLKNANESYIIQLRYIQNKSWEEISIITKYSLRHTHNIHGSALVNIEL